jgi:hypothetical protein
MKNAITKVIVTIELTRQKRIKSLKYLYLVVVPQTLDLIHVPMRFYPRTPLSPVSGSKVTKQNKISQPSKNYSKYSKQIFLISLPAIGFFIPL